MGFKQQIPKFEHKLRSLILQESGQVDLHLLRTKNDSFVTTCSVVFQLVLCIGVHEFIVDAHELNDTFLDPLLYDVDLDLKNG